MKLIEMWNSKPIYFGAWKLPSSSASSIFVRLVNESWYLLFVLLKIPLELLSNQEELYVWNFELDSLTVPPEKI